MSKVLVTESHLNNIAEAIRSKNGAATTYRPGDMAAAIAAIPTGSDIDVEPLSVTQNGTYTAPSGKAYSPVTALVPNTYGSGDEGKVVSKGALVAQTSRTVTENGTYDTTENDEVVVNVSGGGSTLITKTITQNGTYNASADNADGYSQVVVNVSGGSSNIEEWDLTQSLTGKQHGVPLTGAGVVIGGNGAVFDNTGDYLNIPLHWDGITIEIDVAEMNLTSGTHRRFVMGTPSDGLIYRNNGMWAFYASSWVESGETDGAFFDNCIVKIHVDTNGYWHIYKDGVLWWEPSRPLTWGSQTYTPSIGSMNGSSINNAVISGVRIL